MPDNFTIRIEGAEKVVEALGKKRAAILKAMRGSLREGILRIRGTIVESFGTAGKPRSVSGRLRRAIRTDSENIDFGARAIVGVESKVPYGRILEFGGVQPARTIVPRTRKALRWLTGESAGFFKFALSGGLTTKQATRVSLDPKLGGGKVAFAKKVVQPSRFQKAFPYFEPGFAAEKPGIEQDLKKRLAEALGS